MDTMLVAGKVGKMGAKKAETTENSKAVTMAASKEQSLADKSVSNWVE